MLKIFFLIIVVIVFNACQQCEPTTEPNIIVSFSWPKSYTSFKTLNDTTFHTFKNNILPLAINQDTTRLILKDSTNQDTLIISYRRTFNYEKSNCGYEIRLNDFKLVPTKSFKSGVFSLNNNSKISANYALNLDN